MTDILATIQSGLKAPKDKENKFGGYNYRNAESILRAFKEVQPEGVSLIMSDAITFIGDRLFLVATVKLHYGGQVIGEAQGAAMHALAKKGMDDAQITGACSSYARKYALCGLFAIDDSTDDPDSKDNHRATEDAAENARATGKAEQPPFDPQAAHDRIMKRIMAAPTYDALAAVWTEESDTVKQIGLQDRDLGAALYKARNDRKAEFNQSKEAA